MSNWGVLGYLGAVGYLVTWESLGAVGSFWARRMSLRRQGRAVKSLFALRPRRGGSFRKGGLAGVCGQRPGLLS